MASERLVLHAESASTEQVVHLARAQPVLRVLRERLVVLERLVLLVRVQPILRVCLELLVPRRTGRGR